MKLKDWADKQGISYLTAWRWFKAGDARLADAYQSDSGTIIVPDSNETSEPFMGTPQSNNVMSIVLKKTVEFSKSNSSVEDFAAWILSNFTLKLNNTSENAPKYSKVKPKPEDIQNHFKQFLKPKGEKPKANMFVTSDPAAFNDLMVKSDDLTAQELADEIHKISGSAEASLEESEVPEVKDLMKDISSAINIPNAYLTKGVTNYDHVTEGVVTRSVDLTPQQQLNYTGSASHTFSNINSLSQTYGDTFTGTFTGNTTSGIAVNGPTLASYYPTSGDVVSTVNTVSVMSLNPNSVFLASEMSASPVIVESNFKPTQKELESLTKVSEIVEKPRRGRKPFKNVKE